MGIARSPEQIRDMEKILAWHVVEGATSRARARGLAKIIGRSLFLGGQYRREIYYLVASAVVVGSHSALRGHLLSGISGDTINGLIRTGIEARYKRPLSRLSFEEFRTRLPLYESAGRPEMIENSFSGVGHEFCRLASLSDDAAASIAASGTWGSLLVWSAGLVVETDKFFSDEPPYAPT